MFEGTSGYFYLDSWVLANIVQLGTQKFSRQFLNYRNDPGGRQFAQMTQAARSGCANNVEGSSRRKTSRQTEMQLTDVARGSLTELSGDFINWLLFQEKVPWSKQSSEARKVYDIYLDKPEYGADIVHDSCVHILTQKKKFAEWLNSEDDVKMANCLLILIARVINMLNHQIESQGESFKKDGGFRENLTKARLEEREKTEPVVKCPECGKRMIMRKARKGRHPGSKFWGCSDYPQCTGILKIED